MSDESIGYKCPYCSTRTLESVATVPYVRGFLLAYQHGTKKFIGCCSCVRLQIYKEAGLSALLGWYSLTALVMNPLFILYCLIRGLFVSKNLEAVRKHLREAGIPEPREEINLARVAYSLAASVIAADNKILPAEVAVAAEIGKNTFEDFVPSDFEKVVENHKNLPEAEELAALLSKVLTEEGRTVMYRYLVAIAEADGAVSEEEQKLLDRMARSLEVKER
jgi:uncharacterized tellurite resistance protein B-like protein